MAKIGIYEARMDDDSALPVSDTSTAASSATLGAVDGAAVVADANGTIQQYLRGLVKLVVAKITVLLGAGEAHVGAVGGQVIVVTDTWSRPNDATAYSANDRIGATTSDSGTTALRGLAIARVAGGSGYVTYWCLDTNLTTFLGTVRVHLYNVAQPASAIAGDNAAFAAKFANSLQHIGQFDLPTLALPAGAGSDLVRAFRDDLRIPFKCAAGDTNIYYAYELLNAPTPTNNQTFNETVKSDAD